MFLKEFLKKSDIDPRLIELIIFLSQRSRAIKRAFFLETMKKKQNEFTKNIYGEIQMDLDKYADSIFVEGLKNKKLARHIATEEQEEIIFVEDAKNPFGVVIDPLDGSSLIDVNLTIGSIIGIYPGNVLSEGKHMVAAMYILYGPLTTLTLTTGNGVHEFVLDNKGRFFLREEQIRIPDGKIYAPGALRRDYLPGHIKWIEKLENEGYKLRFSGAFVADVHQILHKGGVFAYPGFKGKEKGKLRLLFEANPIGKIVHDAGGAISNGRMNILDITPIAINDITPIYVGGRKEINLIEKFMTEEG